MEEVGSVACNRDGVETEKREWLQSDTTDKVGLGPDRVVFSATDPIGSVQVNRPEFFATRASLLT